MSAKTYSRSLLALTICAILTLVFAVTGRASAQTVTGSIYGTVADSSGAIIPNSTVTVTNVGTNESHTTHSTSSGEYAFPVLSPGNYKVSAAAAGFGTVSQDNIVLAANQNVNVSFAMKVGDVSTTVDIQAGTTLVDTREATISTTIDQARIEALPLVDRNAYGLVRLVPGITNYTASQQVGDQNNTQFSTNGLPANYNSYYLDGSYNTSSFRGGGNLPPNPDALGEFSILVSNQDAEFGQYPGAVVNTITRSGNNQFHGVVYDFFRNTALNAAEEFTTGVTPLHQNVFGGGFGGPAIRNKLFFYLNYQGTIIHTPEIQTSASLIVPSALERLGNFSASTKKPTVTGCTGTNKPIAPATICLDPVAVAALQYVPPAINAANNPAQQGAPANILGQQGLARLDYQLNAAHKLQFTFFQARGSAAYPNGASTNEIFDYAGANYTDNQSNYIVGDTWVASTHLVNSFRGSYSLHRTIAVPTYPGGRLSELGSIIPEGDPHGLSTQPWLTVTGYFNMGATNPSNSNWTQLQYGINDTLSYTKGRHSARFGGEVIEDRFQETAVNTGSTKQTFSGAYTGNALADFEEGHANAFAQDTGVFQRLHSLDPALFAQDDWRITQRLTLDLGLRWEVFYPFTGQNNVGTFVPGVQSARFPTAPLGLVFNGDPNIPDGILHPSYERFAPRVGFADDVLGNGSLALKGAFGIFYTTTPELFTGLLQQQPFDLAITLTNTSSMVDPYNGIAPYNGVSPFGTPFNPAHPNFQAGATIYSLKPYTSVTPYVEEYNLALQQQFGSNWSAEIAYVGNVIRKFLLPRDENAPIYNPAATTSNASVQSRRPYQPEGSIELFDSANTGSYNSLQISVTRQFAHRFSLLASYVWSKTMNDADISPTAGNSFVLSNENDPAMDYGLSVNDVPNSFVASYLYALPDLHRFGMIGKEVLSGWQLNGITTFQSGGPFNVLSNKDTNFDGIATTDRPNVIGNPRLPAGRPRTQQIAEYFNTAAYALPGTGRLYGTSPRNPLLGPGYKDTDLSAFKKFAFYKESDLLFRVEAYNLFNNVNLTAPDGTFGNALFGVITAAKAPRILQLALKYSF